MKMTERKFFLERFFFAVIVWGDTFTARTLLLGVRFPKKKTEDGPMQIRPFLDAPSPSNLA